MGRAFEQGDHICAFYRNDKEHHRIAVPYIAAGLRRGERCMYVAGSAAALKRFRTALRAVGIDVAAMVKGGALIEATNAQAHLPGGHFDSERMLKMLNDAVEDAPRIRRPVLPLQVGRATMTCRRKSGDPGNPH